MPLKWNSPAEMSMSSFDEITAACDHMSNAVIDKRSIVSV